MELSVKMRNIIGMRREHSEVQWWMFSLGPLGVAFAFFFVFVLPMQIPDKDIILVTGAAAGFAGLQAYWIFRGWQRAEGLTMLLGVVSLVAVGAFVWWYIEFLGEFLRAFSSSPWLYTILQDSVIHY